MGREDGQDTTMTTFEIMPPPAVLGDQLDLTRYEVRAFLSEERDNHNYVPHCDSWLSGWDEEFSRKLGARNWIGMTIPPEYGGHGRTALERYVVTEELLAAGAPVAAHWIADRQIGPTLLRYGTEVQKETFLPGIAKGELYFAIGLSEPDAGSDLAAVRTRANKVAGGWELAGSKVWTSGAHRAHAFFVLARTAPLDTAHRHSGLTQFIVDLSLPGIEIRPILLLNGEHHFNEVILNEVFVPDELVLGSIGEGWKQVTSELAFERSGPERWLSTFPLLAAYVSSSTRSSSSLQSDGTRVVGELTARLWTLRQMSLSVAGALERGEVPDVAAALVKDLGTRLEQDIVEAVRLHAQVDPDPLAEDGLASLLAEAICHSPGFTLRGGTNEILRGVVARALGMR